MSELDERVCWGDGCWAHRVVGGGRSSPSRQRSAAVYSPGGVGGHFFSGAFSSPYTPWTTLSIPPLGPPRDPPGPPGAKFPPSLHGGGFSAPRGPPGGAPRGAPRDPPKWPILALFPFPTNTIGGSWGVGQNGPPGGAKKCTFFVVLNNSPSRDSLGPFFGPPIFGPGQFASLGIADSRWGGMIIAPCVACTAGPDR